MSPRHLHFPLLSRIQLLQSPSSLSFSPFIHHPSSSSSFISLTRTFISISVLPSRHLLLSHTHSSRIRTFTKMTLDDIPQGQVKIHTKESLSQQQQQQQKTQAELEKEIWQEAHRLACEGNCKKYIDPKTGYSVMTELLHRRRGYCCGNACRHCPFDHENVGVPPDVKRANIARGKQERKKYEATHGKPVWADDEEHDFSE